MPSKIIVQEANGASLAEKFLENEIANKYGNDEPLAVKFLMNGISHEQDDVEVQDNDDEGNDVLCGLGSWRPAFLQNFTRPVVFTVIYSFTMMLMGMPNAYFYAITSTIEKVFNINSRVTGFILIGNDISQIIFGVLVGYVGSKTSRPLWISIGLLMCSATCFIYAFNHQLWDGVEIKSFDGGAIEWHSKVAIEPSYELCLASSEVNGTVIPSRHKQCDEDEEGFLTYLNYISLPMALFFLGQFVAGVGNLAITSLGLSYSDDFSKKKNTPMNISFILIARTFGAFLGYMVASVCLRFYIDLKVDPEMNPRDPRWLGAWWLGFVIFGIALAFCACIVILLPRKLPTRYYRKVETTDKTLKMENNIDSEKKLTAKDMLQTICRLLTNKACVYILLSESVLILYMGSSSVFSARYTEVFFGQSASRSSLLIGIFSVSSMLASLMAGAICLKKFKPRATRLLEINCLMRVVQVLLICCQMNLSCNKVDYANVSIDNLNNRFNVESSCSAACKCPMVFQPVCVGNDTYLSPCLAGCTSHVSNDTEKTFSGCSCASNKNFTVEQSVQDPLDVTAMNGICPSTSCDSLKIFLILTVIINFMSSALFPSQGVMFLRCVDKGDKSMALALKSVFMCLIGFLPGPVLYGSVFDTCCLLHESKQCGGMKGNCWVYDVDLLRFRFLGTSILIVSVSTVFCILLYFQVRHRNLSLFEEEEQEEII